MSSRPPRSSSIPIPRSSTASARNIETLLGSPFISPGNQPSSVYSQRHVSSSSSPRRAAAPYGMRPLGSAGGPSTSPIHHTIRSASVSSPLQGRASFEPRVIRGPVPDSSMADLTCFTPPSMSASHARRASMPPARTSTSSKPPPPPPAPLRSTATPVARPSYLEYSALRHLLQTEPAVLPVPARKVETQTIPRYPIYTAASSSDNDDDDDTSPPPRDTRPLPAQTPALEQTFKLPTRWSDQDRHPNLSVLADGRELNYHGPSSNGDKDAATARTSHPIPPACGIFYYEVEILGKEQKAHISIGFAGRSVKFTRLPGWEPNSWGYYGDDSFSSTSDKSGVQYGPSFGVADVIGCGIDFTTHKAFYTKNGTLIAPAFENVGRNMDLYPTIGLQHLGEVIRANFGQEPFKYDIDSHVQQQGIATWNKIMTTPLGTSILNRPPITPASSSTSRNPNDVISEEDSKSILNHLVQSYLVHHGYAKTAKALEQQVLKQKAQHLTAPTSSDDDVDMGAASSKTGVNDIEIENRARAVNSVLEGNIDLSIAELRKYYPSVLEVDGQMMWFKLRCRKFIELMLATTEMRRKVKKLKERESAKRKAPASDEFWMDEEMSMEVDDDAFGLTTTTNGSGYPAIDGDHEDRSENTIIQYEAALNEAIAYGRSLSNDYQSDPRPEVQDIFKKTCGIVAWEDPLEAGSPVAEFVGHESRIELAHEVNDAILKSQGWPAQPALETLYRHTATCILQLGLFGVGAAAFADMQKEFLQ